MKGESREREKSIGQDRKGRGRAQRGARLNTQYEQ